MKRIVLIAGEASGDAIGEGLVLAIKNKYPHCEILGMGGDKMIQAGLKPWAHIDQLSVMGILEVLKHLPKILKLRRFLFRKIINTQPDILIGIDAPDFNLGLEKKIKKIKKAGIPVVHYVSPTIWAWKAGRIKTIKQATDSVLCIFPFEPLIYQNNHHRAVFVGHPLADQINFDLSKQNYCEKLQLNPNQKYLAILPGSREFEINALLPIFLKTVGLFRKKYPEFEFLLPIARESLREKIKFYLADYNDLPIYLISGQAQSVLGASDLALLASGTVSLEAGLLNTPSIVAYKLSKFSYWLAKKLVKISHISLPNLLLNQKIFPEFLQEQVTPENLFNALNQQWETYQKQLPEFGLKLKNLLTHQASQKALEEIEHVIEDFNRRRG